MSKVSVIVPVYNTEQYLPRCIDSILAQTFTDFELILVNDGSTDNSGMICNEYAKKDSRIIVIHKENGGVSSARNLGIDNAKGKYITFVDSDDYILSQYLDNIYTCLIKVKADLIFTSYTDIINEEKSIVKINYDFNCLEDYVSFFIINGNFTAPWGKFFSRKIINENSLYFPYNIHRGEDTIFVYNYLLHCKKIYFIADYNYNYNRILDGASLSQKHFPYTIENITKNKLIESIYKLNTKYKLNANAKIEIINWKLDLQERIISCINIIPQKSERINCLKEQDWKFYKKYKRFNTWKEAILKQFLKWECFYIYDFLAHLKK